MIKLKTETLITNRQRCQQLIEDALSQAGLGELARSFAEGIVETLEKEEVPAEPSPPGSFPLIVPKFNYIIRNSDLDLLSRLKDGLLALASSDFVFDNMTPRALVTFAFMFATLGRALWLKGVFVEPIPMLILTTLQQNGPATSQTLASLLPNSDAEWSSDQVTEVLESLGKITLRNGDVVALVAQASDERWSTVDL